MLSLPTTYLSTKLYTGTSPVPHAALGSARRWQVGDPGDQHVLLKEAVHHHAPQVLVVDELLTQKVGVMCKNEHALQFYGTDITEACHCCVQDTEMVEYAVQRGIPVMCGICLARLGTTQLSRHPALAPLLSYPNQVWTCQPPVWVAYPTRLWQHSSHHHSLLAACAGGQGIQLHTNRWASLMLVQACICHD
jgi:hypothetical protein